MTSTSWLYLTSQAIQGTHAGGLYGEWQGSSSAGLPTPDQLIENGALDRLHPKAVGLLIQDDLLHPLRLELEEDVPRKDMVSYLKWKLKRLLPFPIEQVEIRYAAMTGTRQYLTYSMPSPWVQAVYSGLEKHGITCGYIGGLFATLLENQAALRGKVSLALFDDFYQLAELDARGGYRLFRSRRLPLHSDQRLDTTTLIRTDLEPMLREMDQDKPIVVFNFATRLGEDYGGFCRSLKQVLPEVMAQPARGTVLERFLAVFERGVGS